MRQPNRVVISGSAAGLLLLGAASADAYIGPGAGLSLFGALWALIAAVGAAFAFIVLWPVRKAMQRRTSQKKAATAVSQSAAAEHADGSAAVPEEAMRAVPETLSH